MRCQKPQSRGFFCFRVVAVAASSQQEQHAKGCCRYQSFHMICFGSKLIMWKNSFLADGPVFNLLPMGEPSVLVPNSPGGAVVSPSAGAVGAWGCWARGGRFESARHKKEQPACACGQPSASLPFVCRVLRCTASAPRILAARPGSHVRRGAYGCFPTKKSRRPHRPSRKASRRGGDAGCCSRRAAARRRTRAPCGP